MSEGTMGIPLLNYINFRAVLKLPHWGREKNFAPMIAVRIRSYIQVNRNFHRMIWNKTSFQGSNRRT